MAVVLGALLVAWLLLELLRPFSVLQVRVLDDAGQSSTALVLPAAEGFEVRYTHSYNHFTVREFFERDTDHAGVVVVDQYVNGEGAGIAEVADETRFVSVGDGWSRLEGLERSLDGPLRFRIGHVADHHLINRCRDVALTDIGEPMAAAEIGWSSAGPATYLRAHLADGRARPAGTSCAPPATSTSAGR